MDSRNLGLVSARLARVLRPEGLDAATGAALPQQLPHPHAVMRRAIEHDTVEQPFHRMN